MRAREVDIEALHSAKVDLESQLRSANERAENFKQMLAVRERVIDDRRQVDASAIGPRQSESGSAVMQQIIVRGICAPYRYRKYCTSRPPSLPAAHAGLP